MAAKKKVEQKQPMPTVFNRKNIASNIVNNINKQSDIQVAFLLGGPSKTPADISGWLSTGNDLLDVYISNRKYSGIALGRITQLSSMQSGGKSLQCAHLVKSCQKIGGIAVYIDTEQSTSKQFLSAIGVNLQEVVYLDMRGIQQIYNTIQSLVKSIRTQYADVPVLIVIDSLTAASPQEQIEADHSQRGFDTLKSRINSRSMKKLVGMIARQKIALVYTTQLRANMQTFGYGDKYTTSSGGYAPQFYATTRLEYTKAGTLKVKIKGIDKVVGQKVIAKIKKSKLGPANGKCQFNIRYDSGIDNYDTYLQHLNTYKLISGKGIKSSPYVVKIENEQIVIDGKFAQFMQNNPQPKDKIYNMLADIIIMEYRKAQSPTQAGEVFVEMQDDDFAG